MQDQENAPTSPGAEHKVFTQRLMENALQVRQSFAARSRVEKLKIIFILSILFFISFIIAHQVFIKVNAFYHTKMCETSVSLVQINSLCYSLSNGVDAKKRLLIFSRAVHFMQERHFKDKSCADLSCFSSSTLALATWVNYYSSKKHCERVCDILAGEENSQKEVQKVAKTQVMSCSKSGNIDCIITAFELYKSRLLELNEVEKGLLFGYYKDFFTQQQEMSKKRQGKDSWHNKNKNLPKGKEAEIDKYYV